MSVTPGVICPIAAPTFFTDSWGAPRSGGRRHQGTDMVAAHMAPLVAVADGVVRISFTSLGGNVIHLWADHGVDYFYAHLDSYAVGLVDGQRVERGQLIGYNGDTGNAIPGAYHVHFGMRPGGITNVNPYPTVRAVCP
jgi:murein DD-endopeptidase MepM/ murein hydrolase activator NlpD